MITYVRLCAALLDQSSGCALDQCSACDGESDSHARSLVKGSRQRLDVIVIEVRRRLVERHHAAVQTERLGESETDDNRSEDFLTGAAASTHVHLVRVLEHDDLQVSGWRMSALPVGTGGTGDNKEADPIIVRARSSRRLSFGIGLDHNLVDICLNASMISYDHGERAGLSVPVP